MDTMSLLETTTKKFAGKSSPSSPPPHNNNNKRNRTEKKNDYDNTKKNGLHPQKKPKNKNDQEQDKIKQKLTSSSPNESIVNKVLLFKNIFKNPCSGKKGGAESRNIRLGIRNFFCEYLYKKVITFFPEGSCYNYNSKFILLVSSFFFFSFFPFTYICICFSSS